LSSFGLTPECRDILRKVRVQNAERATWSTSIRLTKLKYCSMLIACFLHVDGNWTLDHDERFAKGFFVWDVNKDGFIDANEV